MDYHSSAIAIDGIDAGNNGHVINDLRNDVDFDDGGDDAAFCRAASH